MKKLLLILISIIFLLAGCEKDVSLQEKYDALENDRLTEIRDGAYESIDQALNAEMEIFKNSGDSESLYYICDIITRNGKYKEYRNEYYYYLFEYMLEDEELVIKANQMGYNFYFKHYIDILFEEEDKHWIDLFNQSSKYYVDYDFEVNEVALLCATHCSEMNDEEFDFAFNKLLDYEDSYNKLFYSSMEKKAQLMLYFSIYVMADYKEMTEYTEEYSTKYKKQYRKVLGKKYDGNRVK